jgi:uncharacterized iron-regulated protein
MRPSRLLVLAICLATTSAAAQDRTLDLPIGDPARSGRHAPVVLDAITDTRVNDTLTPSELAARLDDVQVLFVGEYHTSQAFHDVQFRVIQELQRRGRRVVIGLEMYPYPSQHWLDEFTSGQLTEEEFLTRSRWYGTWGYHWNYYRDIFLFARDHKLRLAAVNVPRPVVRTVREKGLDALDPATRAYLPPRIETDSEDHRRLFRAYFGEGDALHDPTRANAAMDGMFQAQCTWDAAMAQGTIRALRAADDPKAIAVVLVGIGHVAYGLGAERQAATFFNGRMASLIPVPVADEQGHPVTQVRASYASFVWGIPQELAPTYPMLGLSTRDEKQGHEHFTIIEVTKGQPAARAGIKPGDLLVSIDGVAIDDLLTMNRLMADKRWGDAVDVVIVRGTEKLAIRVVLRRVSRVPVVVQ